MRKCTFSGGRKRSIIDPKMVLASAGRELETLFIRRDT